MARSGKWLVGAAPGTGPEVRRDAENDTPGRQKALSPIGERAWPERTDSVPQVCTALLRMYKLLRSHVFDELYDLVGVTPFVVVPAHELHEVAVEGDTCIGVEDGGARIADEIRRYDRIFGIARMPLSSFSEARFTSALISS